MEQTGIGHSAHRSDDNCDCRRERSVAFGNGARMDVPATVRNCTGSKPAAAIRCVWARPGFFDTMARRPHDVLQDGIYRALTNMEFDLIALIRERCSIAREDVRLGIGDDAALLAVPAGQLLAVSTDTLVAGVHFPQ